jgi:hypothetical protein
MWIPRRLMNDRRDAGPAPACRVDGVDGLHSRLPNDQRSASRRRPQAGATLELVDETTDQEIDVDALHDALAVLLVRYHRAMNASEAPAR